MNPITSLDGQTALPRYFASTYSLTKKLQNGRIDFRLPDGRLFRVDAPSPGPVTEITVHNEDVFARLIREGDLGFADAYLEGWWSTPDLQAFMDVIHADNDDVYESFGGHQVVRLVERLRHWMNRNTREQAKKNISHHYDLGNEFYSIWLDATMTYSSAKFDDGQESLEKAQSLKYKSLIDQMGARPGDHVLEIGCGWGGFAEYAAREHGLRITGLTISREQYNFARKRMKNAGLSDKVEIKLQDYRDETGSYDGIASIEMFEAVGEKYWANYFEALKDRLKPGRNATLQIITIEDKRFDMYRKGVDFIQKYIFPGGMLPSPTALRTEVERAGLSVLRSIEFGESYSQTLRRWHDTFNERWNEVSLLGFDDRFRRMWNFYLTSCAAGFHTGTIDVTQITVTKPG